MAARKSKRNETGAGMPGEAVSGARDEFPKAVREVLGRRVAFRCSNPGCRQGTIGPRENSGKTIDIGVAAHICAASPGGPRFDSSMTSEQRASSSNGIWLCQNCGKLVDNDEKRHTAGILEEWKRLAEDAALLEVQGKPPEGGREPSDVELVGGCGDPRESGGDRLIVSRA